MTKAIKQRIIMNGGLFKANDNISEYLVDGDIDKIRNNVKEAVVNLLDALIIDVDNDHNTNETAKRVAKMYVDEIFKGRYQARPMITKFPNSKQLDEIYTVGPITIRSMCSHHFVPIIGKVWVGIIPSNELMGLSKFNRIVDWVGSRPQIQEETVVQIADEIESLIKPKALGVIMKANHMCMTLRGVKDNDCSMTTSVMRGLFFENNNARQELLSLIR
tara:strand:- start:1682 stop:2335 length:654 start_codon:yes stop_codon:yes gene_type:complete